MIKYNFLVPTFILLLIFIFFLLTIISAKTSFYFNERQKFSFRNRFPFELFHQKKEYGINIFRIFLIVLFASCFATNCIFITIFEGTSNVTYASIVSLFFSFSLICSLVLFILKPNLLKQFKIYSTLLFAFTLMSTSMFAILMLSSVFIHYSYKVLCGLSFCLTGINFILMINPKLKKWDRLEQQKNSDGTLIYTRPKISPLAFSLWINYLTIIIGEFLILLAMIFNSLGY